MRAGRPAFHHRPGLVEVYVVCLRSADLPVEDLFQFNEPDDAFDQVEDLKANGDDAFVVRRWLAT